jgi:hypothetical protein
MTMSNAKNVTEYRMMTQYKLTSNYGKRAVVRGEAHHGQLVLTSSKNKLISTRAQLMIGDYWQWATSPEGDVVRVSVGY